MARIYPFQALRYDPARVNMEDVVTQPYDKISPAMQQRYYQRSPYNLIRVILGKAQEGDNDDNNVYTRADESLKAWRSEGILKEESEPALYGYSQTYTVPGTAETRERRGFIALGHLYDYAEQVIFRHEQTFPKHKSDRLALFKQTRAYCEQIYLLYSDPGFTAEKLIFGTAGDSNDTRPADLSITDEYGVVHRVWKLTDPTLINLIVTAMADKKLIIADGHHRYETSVAYMKERAAALGHDPSNPEHVSPSNAADQGHSQLPVPAFPEAAMMMTFVNMEAPGITILPTHRVVFGLKSFNVREFLKSAEAFFSVEQVPAADMNALNDIPGVVFYAATSDATYLLKAKPDAIAETLSSVSPRQQQLDVVPLHRLVLERILGLTPESIAQLKNIRYIRETNEVLDQLHSREADIAFLIKPVTLDQLKDVSYHLEVMPQKSTDFYPKLLSGLAIYALD